MHEKTDAAYQRRRRWLAGISLGIVVLLAGLATWFVWRWLDSFSEDQFRAYIRSFGAWGWLVMLGLQILQVFVALIPGELLESASGYAFGPVGGTLICYLGVAVGSAIIFWLTRRFGVRLVEVFISREKINELRFLKTARRRDRLVFWIFFLPGTPKDLLTYFVGLTDMRFATFMLISLVARIPSVLSSTFGGHLLGEGNYMGALWLYGITGLVSLGGVLIYNAVLRRRKKGTTDEDCATGPDNL